MVLFTAYLGLFVVLTSEVPAANASHIATTTLFANSAAWNTSSLLGSNPALTVLGKLGFTVNVKFDDAIYAQHNFAIYPKDYPAISVFPGNTAALGRTLTVSSTTLTTSKSFTLQSGIYEYYCEYHSPTMHSRILAYRVDVNDDNKVNLDDLLLVFVNQNTSNLQFDVDLNGKVNLDDLLQVFVHQNVF